MASEICPTEASLDEPLLLLASSENKRRKNEITRMNYIKPLEPIYLNIWIEFSRNRNGVRAILSQERDITNFTLHREGAQNMAPHEKCQYMKYKSSKNDIGA